MKIRTKIMMGFLILALMLIIAGAYSIYELTTLSASVQHLLDDNYKSIHAAKQMIESLEREDSGILLLLLGKWKEGRNTINDADKNFMKALDIAKNNLTITGEKDIIDAISSNYLTYRKHWDQPIVDTEYEGNLKWYFEQIHRDFIAVKTTVQNLMAINDQTMYKTASMLKNRAHRAVMPGIIAIAAALVFTLIFNFFVNLYIVNPILTIISSAKNFLQTGKPIKLKIHTNDEINDLANSVINLTTMVQNNR